MTTKNNKMNKLILSLSTILIMSSSTIAQSYNNWRGPARDGHYTETGLLKQWPANGPEMLWSYDQIGSG